MVRSKREPGAGHPARPLPAWCLTGLLATAAALPAAAAGPGLPLGEALAITLERGVGIRLAEQQAEVGRGDLLQARGLFDGLLSAAATRIRTDDPALLPNAVDTTEVGVAWSQRLRSGPTIVPSLFVTRSAVAGDGSEASNSGGVDVAVSVPLLRDRGGAVGRLTEESAGAAHRADLVSLLHERSADLVATAGAYWRYLAAQRRLTVFSESETRAERLVEQTRLLVEAKERPAADLNQVEANAAGKRIQRLAAAQALVEVRRSLGLAMGLSPADLDSIPPASDGFPVPAPAAVDPTAVAAWVAAARRQRADLRASESLVEAADLALRAAESQLLPRLDLTLSAGYRGLAVGGGTDAFLEALHRRVPGVTATVGVSYDLPHENLIARGREMRNRALLEQQRILHEDLDRRIASGVRVAALDLESAIARAAFTQTTVTLSRATVEAEREKYGLGLATLFDVILAEDGLTSALLSEIDVRLAHALALADLRFETGTLAATADPTAEALADRLTSVPES